MMQSGRLVIFTHLTLKLYLTKTGVVVIQPTFAYSKSTIETLEKGVKYVQSLAYIESNSANKSQPLFRLDLKLIV